MLLEEAAAAAAACFAGTAGTVSGLGSGGLAFFGSPLLVAMSGPDCFDIFVAGGELKLSLI